ncbi:N/A [soil metagenome]
MIKFFLDPFNILWLLVLMGLVLLVIKRKPVARLFFIGAGIWFIVISTPLVPIMLLNTLEDQYEPVSPDQLDPDAEYHIVVLGGGHGFDDRLPPNSLLSLNALGRLNEGIRLHRELPNSTMIFSGYSSSGGTTQAEMLLHTALLLGVEEENTLIQKEPGNTFEEARVYSERFAGDETVILVTSASHMPRAVIVFERFGVSPIASPTNYRLRGSWKHVRFGLPRVSNIEMLRVSFFERAAVLRERFR